MQSRRPRSPRAEIMARVKVAEGYYQAGRFGLAYSLLRHIAIDLLIPTGPYISTTNRTIHKGACDRLIQKLNPYLTPAE